MSAPKDCAVIVINDGIEINPLQNGLLNAVVNSAGNSAGQATALGNSAQQRAQPHNSAGTARDTQSQQRRANSAGQANSAGHAFLVN